MFKTINGFPNYEVSDSGEIRNIKRDKLLTSYISRFGYKRVRLFKDGKCFQFMVHRLVADAFALNPNKLPQVNHLDGIKTNNVISNLEWVTRSQNQQHAWYQLNVNSGWVKQPVICINNGVTYPSIGKAAQILGLDPSNVGKCARGTMSETHGYRFIKV